MRRWCPTVSSYIWTNVFLFFLDFLLKCLYSAVNKFIKFVFIVDAVSDHFELITRYYVLACIANFDAVITGWVMGCRYHYGYHNLDLLQYVFCSSADIMAKHTAILKVANGMKIDFYLHPEPFNTKTGNFLPSSFLIYFYNYSLYLWSMVFICYAKFAFIMLYRL